MKMNDEYNLDYLCDEYLQGIKGMGYIIASYCQKPLFLDNSNTDLRNRFRGNHIWWSDLYHWENFEFCYYLYLIDHTYTLNHTAIIRNMLIRGFSESDGVHVTVEFVYLESCVHFEIFEGGRLKQKCFADVNGMGRYPPPYND